MDPLMPSHHGDDGIEIIVDAVPHATTDAALEPRQPFADHFKPVLLRTVEALAEAKARLDRVLDPS